MDSARLFFQSFLYILIIVIYFCCLIFKPPLLLGYMLYMIHIIIHNNLTQDTL